MLKMLPVCCFSFLLETKMADFRVGGKHRGEKERKSEGITTTLFPIQKKEPASVTRYNYIGQDPGRKVRFISDWLAG